jgi:hypothetical protein
VQAIVFPRERLREFKQNPDWAKCFSVYLLVGRRDEAAKPEVYIGQSTKPRERLAWHARDPEKVYWEMTIVAISPSPAEPFSRDDIAWLECQCIRKATEANRFEVHADRNPDPEAVRNAGGLATVLEGLTTLVSVLGYPMFEPLADIDVPSDEDTLPPSFAPNAVFHCKSSLGADATGAFAEGGFIVRGGSLARPHIVPSAKETDEPVRQKLIDDGILTGEGGKLRFAQDHTFRSVSGAASVVLGRTANGYIEWEDENGRTLDEIRRPSGCPEKPPA